MRNTPKRRYDSWIGVACIVIAIVVLASCNAYFQTSPARQRDITALEKRIEEGCR